MLAPLQPIVLLILKWGVRRYTSHGHVYMITFRFGHIYIYKLLIQYLYLCSRGVTPRTPHREIQGSNPVRIFFVYSLFLFFSFAFLVWKFDVLFVDLLVVVFCLYGNSKQTRSLLLLDPYYSAWRAICDSYHRFYPWPENLFHVM